MKLQEARKSEGNESLPRKARPNSRKMKTTIMRET